MPADLENYVLKPLFSFAGQGVVIDVTPADIEKVKDPENWILQRKVKYADQGSAAALIGRNAGTGMADAFYALEKLADALYALATGSGRVQERLGDAAIFLIRVRPEDISDENLRRIFIGVMDDLSYAQAQWWPLREEKKQATIRLTSHEDGASIPR